MPIRRWCILLLGLLLAAPAAAEDTVWREPLWLQPPGADAPFPVLRPRRSAGSRATPPSSSSPTRTGRSVARPPGPGPAGGGTGVVELDPVAARAVVPALPPTPALDPAERPAALRAALRLLRTETGAGMLVVLGLGQAGPLALAAVAEPNLAAAVALAPQPRFLAGAPPPAAEQWPLRAGLLCGLLADLAPPATAPATLRDCRAALFR